ncbi:MAG: acyl-CoA reductase, partial [Vulcanimicrobiaceae bacterium]
MSLRELSVREIIAAIAAAAGRWADPGFAPRAQTTDAVADRTGYSKPVVAYAFDALFGAITADAIAATIAGELGSLDALDGFVARPGRPDGFARGVERV